MTASHGGCFETSNLPHVSSTHFVMSYVRQNKKTLESEQYGLEIIFKQVTYYYCQSSLFNNVPMQESFNYCIFLLACPCSICLFFLIFLMVTTIRQIYKAFKSQIKIILNGFPQRMSFLVSFMRE